MIYPINVQSPDGLQPEKENDFRARLYALAKLSEEMVVGNFCGKLIYFNGDKSCKQKRILLGIL